MKLCTKCTKIKSFQDFNKRGDNSNRLRSHCKRCSYKSKGPRKSKYLSLKAKQEAARQSCARYNATPERKAKQAFYEAARRSKKANATPVWLSEYQIDSIKINYIVAKSMSDATGLKFEVDHIVPLKGKIVSGLHVPWNLQIMVKQANQIKSNRI